ncbi:MAG: tetratricopeptide repeat protein [Tepidisphaeraceae bacterium]
MPQIRVDCALQMAQEQHRAGRFAEAEGLYRQILSQLPDNLGAMHPLAVLLAQQGRGNEALPLMRRVVQLQPQAAAAHSDLGNLLRDQGRLDDAVAALRCAIALQPDWAPAHGNLANVLRDQGRTDDAVAAYRRAIQLKPDYFEAYSNLGNALVDKGNLNEAITCYQRAIQLMPGFAMAHNNLGVALKKMGRLDEALAAFRRAIELVPEYPDAHNNLGQALEAIGRLDEAIAAYHRAIQLKPDLAGAFSNLGNALLDQRRVNDSISACRRAIEIQPDMAEAHNNLGNALSDSGCLDEAIAAYRQALRLKPDYAQALNNLGGALIDSGRFDEPQSLFRRAMQIDPEFPDAHWNLALFLLLHGNFAEGLPEYEWRWKVKKVLRPPPFSQPRWDGHDLNGQTILLQAEQGFGDAIQFIRYAPLVAARGARVIVQCPVDLKRLFSRMPIFFGMPGSQVLAAGEPLPKFDFHCPLLSLPLAFKTDLHSIPSSVPYLQADPELVETWRGKLPTGDNRRRIGLAWAGSATHVNDRNRSILPANFAPLAQVKDDAFYSLQKGDSAKSLPPAGMSLIDFTYYLKDFADTAAMIENLDMVISVDTSVAHLAGAMGKPVWLLLPCNPDWRWMLQRLDSPWYPTMRLFRQKRAGEWRAAIEETAAALRTGER